MIERIIEILSRFIEHLNPFVICNDYEKGVLFRFGKFSREVNPGLTVKIPVVDHVVIEDTRSTNISGDHQSLMSIDGKQVLLSLICKYRVVDIKKFVLAIYMFRDAIDDILASYANKVVSKYTWDQLVDMDLEGEIAQRVKKDCLEYGVKIEAVRIKNFAKMKSFRIVGADLFHKE